MVVYMYIVPGEGDGYGDVELWSEGDGYGDEVLLSEGDGYGDVMLFRRRWL